MMFTDWWKAYDYQPIFIYDLVAFFFFIIQQFVILLIISHFIYDLVELCSFNQRFVSFDIFINEWMLELTTYINWD